MSRSPALYVRSHRSWSVLVQGRMQGARPAMQWQSQLQAFCRQQASPGLGFGGSGPLPVNNSGKIVKPGI
jgi:hypothetical protein